MFKFIPIKNLGLLGILILLMQCNHTTKDLNDNQTSYKTTDLHFAARKGLIERVKELLKREEIDINAKDEKGNTALHLATLGRHTSVVKFLLQNGADVNAKDAEGRTSLNLAASENFKYCNNNAVIYTLLQSEKINTDAKDDKLGFTPFHLFTFSNNIELLKILLDKGVNINTKSSTGLTALHIAAINENRTNQEIIKFLLNKKADITIQNNQGITPLHEAVTAQGYVEEECILEIMLKLSNQAKIVINKQDNHGNTALHLAILFKDPYKISILLENPHIDVNIKDEYGNTPLHGLLLDNASFYIDYNEIIKKLLEKGAKINIKNNENETALNIAARLKDSTASKSLFEAIDQDSCIELLEHNDALEYSEEIKNWLVESSTKRRNHNQEETTDVKKLKKS